ncbi:DMT family transporter [Crocinitomix catalasitica]|uniref:DMT family transporter n=1 Tax=Crocinitomix catalasitica TaxID=184607 RepID=UPI0006885B64|nr:DMT family transporter [Crocinitomix catalasitica]
MFKGVLYMLFSSLCFAIVNLMVKTLSDSTNVFPTIQNYPVHELILFRSLISLAICIAIVKHQKIKFFGNNKKWLLIRGVFGVTSLTLFFFTLKHLPIAIATVVQYLSPIFTIIFAIYLHKEKVRPIQWIFFLVALLGVAFIGNSKSQGLEIQLIWVLVGLCSAVLSGVSYNAIMKCRTTDAPITVVMYFPLIATPVMIIACFFYGFLMPQGIEWLLLILIGVFTQFAQLFMTKAFNSDAAARITPIKYIGAIYAVCIGYFIFDEDISLIGTLGIALILIGVLLNTFFKQIFRNKKSRLSKV